MPRGAPAPTLDQLSPMLLVERKAIPHEAGRLSGQARCRQNASNARFHPFGRCAGGAHCAILCPAGRPALLPKSLSHGYGGRGIFLLGPGLDGLPVFRSAFAQRLQHIPHHPFLPGVIVGGGRRVRNPARRGQRAIERRRLAWPRRRRRTACAPGNRQGGNQQAEASSHFEIPSRRRRPWRPARSGWR
jgi:hypothetical protein